MDKLEKQIRAAIKKYGNGKIDIAEALNSLDLGLMINPRDTYRKEAIVKAIIFRNIKDLKFQTSLEKFLKDNRKVAFKLGFLKNKDNKEQALPSDKSSNEQEFQIYKKTRYLIPCLM